MNSYILKHIVRNSTILFVILSCNVKYENPKVDDLKRSSEKRMYWLRQDLGAIAIEMLNSINQVPLIEMADVRKKVGNDFASFKEKEVLFDADFRDLCAEKVRLNNDIISGIFGDETNELLKGDGEILC